MVYSTVPLQSLDHYVLPEWNVCATWQRGSGSSSPAVMFTQQPQPLFFCTSKAWSRHHGLKSWSTQIHPLGMSIWFPPNKCAMISQFGDLDTKSLVVSRDQGYFKTTDPTTVPTRSRSASGQPPWVARQLKTYHSPAGLDQSGVPQTDFTKIIYQHNLWTKRATRQIVKAANILYQNHPAPVGFPGKTCFEDP